MDVQYFGSLNEPHYTSINISKRLQYKCEEAMQLLSMRQRQILDFVSTQGHYVSVHDLAEKFQVSERAIQYDIEFIESMTDVLHITLERDKANGIKIVAMDQHIPNTKTSHNRVIHYAKSERILYIILKLFESSQPTSSQAFAEMVSVSRRTIVEDLKDVQKWLDEQSLALTYVKNKGFIIEGDEHNFRKAYAARVNEYFDTHTHQIGNQLFSNQDLKQIRLTVTSILMEHQYQLVQSAIDGLIYHILIAIHRTKEEYTFKIPKSEYERLSQTDQFQIATVIAQRLEAIFDIQFPTSEAAFITLHLLGAKSAEENVMIERTDNLELYILKLIEYMSGELGVDLMSDNKLLNGLLVHLQPAIYRMKFNMSHDKPLLEEIQTQYRHIVDALNRHLNAIELAYDMHFDDHEIAYITLHFASAIERGSSLKRKSIKVVLLCGSGIGTSQLLKSKIINIYPELEVVDAYSVYEISEEQLRHEGVDYVISTVPVKSLSVPVINVSPFLAAEDRLKLNNIINEAREQYVSSIKSVGPTLNQVLPQANILISQPKVDRDAAIVQSVDLLVKQDIVGESYASAIIQQLDKFGPYMVISPQIALIHANHDQVKQGVGFSLVHYEEGIRFNHKQYDPVRIVITLATEQPKIHLNALRQLSELLMDEQKRASLLQGDLAQIISSIDEVSNK